MRTVELEKLLTDKNRNEVVYQFSREETDKRVPAQIIREFKKIAAIIKANPDKPISDCAVLHETVEWNQLRRDGFNPFQRQRVLIHKDRRQRCEDAAHKAGIRAEHQYLQFIAEQMGYELSFPALMRYNPAIWDEDMLGDYAFHFSFTRRRGLFMIPRYHDEWEKAIDFYRKLLRREPGWRWGYRKFSVRERTATDFWKVDK